MAAWLPTRARSTPRAAARQTTRSPSPGAISRWSLSLWQTPHVLSLALMRLRLPTMARPRYLRRSPSRMAAANWLRTPTIRFLCRIAPLMPETICCHAHRRGQLYRHGHGCLHHRQGITLCHYARRQQGLRRHCAHQGGRRHAAGPRGK